jgi:hypothetical protein
MMGRMWETGEDEHDIDWGGGRKNIEKWDIEQDLDKGNNLQERGDAEQNIVREVDCQDTDGGDDREDIQYGERWDDGQD